MPEYPTSLERCYELVADLRKALESRDLIGQAKGILMEREHFSADDAFAVLVRASQRQNRKVRAIAEDIVTGVDN